MQVHPAYTSAEGRWRLAPDLGGSVHEAAALCIGRKALRYRRRFPRRLRGRLETVRKALAAEAGRRRSKAKRLATMEEGSPAEGRARTIATACKRIGTMRGDARLARSEAVGAQDVAAWRARDFPRWRRRRGERDGPWAALVELQRARWGRALWAGSAETRRGALQAAGDLGRGGIVGPGRSWQRTRAVQMLSGPGGSPGVGGAETPCSPSPSVAYAPRGANPRPKGAKTWSGGRCGRPRDRFDHIFLTRWKPYPRTSLCATCTGRVWTPLTAARRLRLRWPCSAWGTAARARTTRSWRVRTASPTMSTSGPGVTLARKPCRSGRGSAAGWPAAGSSPRDRGRAPGGATPAPGR